MHALRHHDYYMISADFDDYVATQRRIDQLWMSSSDWTRMCMTNIANMAWFSSDRAISEYAQEIWNVPVTPTADVAGRGP
jgi:starch phosphorylase